MAHRPYFVLTVGLLAAAAAIVYTAQHLVYQPNRNDLISPKLPWNKRFIDWQENFSGTGTLAIVVDTYDPAGRPDEQTANAAKHMVDDIGDALSRPEMESVELAFWGYDPTDIEQVNPRAMRLQPMEQFAHQLAELDAARPMLESDTPEQMVNRALQEMAQPDQAGAAVDYQAGIHAFAGLIDTFAERLRIEPEQPFAFTEQVEKSLGIEQWQYLHTPNGRFLLIRINPHQDPEALSPVAETIRDVRRVISEVSEQYPRVQVGLTGIDVVEADETEAMISDSKWASFLALALIAALLITAYHGLRKPLLMLASLILGIAWTFGYLSLVIGHLQVVSVFFTVILMGLGVAFAIHINASFELLRSRHADDEFGFAQTLTDTFESVGPGVVTGAVTTAAALATTMFTSFRGVAEMGHIAAVGVLLCLAAMFSIYPALLRLFRFRASDIKPVERRFVKFFEERWVMPFVRHPKPTLIVSAVIFVAALAMVSQMRFDYNLLALMPSDIASVQWAERLQDEGDRSIYYGVSLVDEVDQAGELIARYRELPDVKRDFGGVGLLFPADEPRKLEMIRAERARLAGVIQSVLHPGESTDSPPAPPPQENLVTQVTALGPMLDMLGGSAPAELRPALGRLRAAIERFREAAAQLTPEQLEARLAALRTDYRQWRVETTRMIDMALSTGPVRFDDLPAALMDAYRGRINGQTRYALEVFPQPPPGVVDPIQPPFLGQFVGAMRTVDPNVTGVIVQYYESGTLIWRSYLMAGLFALVVVWVLVRFDFNSLTDAAQCLLPVVVGFAVTFAIMWLMGQQINPANIIVLPMMFGIGVDAGVHILHRFKQNPDEQPPGLTAGTGRGITLTSYTTMIGFGALMFASHRGIRGLGFVMALGIGMTLVACWVVMPALLTLRQRKRAGESAENQKAQKTEETQHAA